MYSDFVVKLQNLAAPIVERHGAFMVDIGIRGERTSKVVELFIDSDTGVSIDVCSNVSREFSAALDQTDLLSGRYRLDVSSPDLNRPLKHHRQYIKNIGRRVSVKYTADGTTSVIEGRIESVNDTTFLLETKNGKKEILFNDSVETTIVPQFK